MTYQSNIPQPGDFLQISQKDMLDNFSEIFKSFTQGHVAFDLKGEGKHTNFTLETVGDPTTSASQVALYAKSGTGSNTQLFYRPNNNQTPIQLSYQSVGTNGPQQYSFLAGPFIFYFGYLRGVTLNQVVTLTPNSTTLLGAFVNPSSLGYNPMNFANSNIWIQPINFVSGSPTSFTLLTCPVINTRNTGTPPIVDSNAFYIAVGVI